MFHKPERVSGLRTISALIAIAVDDGNESLSQQ